MEKSDYLQNLERTLKANFSQQQANDILADYTEFFDTGIAEGKSESELCAEFGNPEKVAKELLGDSILTLQKQSVSFWRKIALLVVINISFLQLTFSDWNIQVYGHIFTFLFPLLLQAIIYMSCSKNLHAVASNTSKLFYFRQRWLTGWRFVSIVFFLSVVLGWYIVSINTPIWQNPNLLGYFFIYVPAIILITAIEILCSIYPAKVKGPQYLKLLFILSYSLIAVLFVVLFVVLSKLETLNPFNPDLFKVTGQLYDYMAILSYSIMALSIFTIILVTIYAIHVNANAKWLLFFSTTCFSILLNGVYILFNFANGSVPNCAIFLHSIRNSILLNLGAALLFFLFMVIWNKYCRIRND